MGSNYLWQTTVKGSKTPQDRVHVAAHEGSLLVIVADGAGGSAGGDLAADMVIQELGAMPSEAWAHAEWDRLLRKLDRKMQHTACTGETTAVVLALHGEHVRGASVGDSGAWLLRGTAVQNLTRHQERKPLLGSGTAYPVAFDASMQADETLLVATDGLLKYARPTTITQLCALPNMEDIIGGLVASVRLPSGDWWDDVGIALCRMG